MEINKTDTMNCISNVSKKVKKGETWSRNGTFGNVINLVCKNGLLYFEIQYLSDGEIFKADKNYLQLVL